MVAKERLSKELRTKFVMSCMNHYHRVLQGAALRGAQFTSFLRFSGPPFSCSKMSLLDLETCTPMKATP